MNRKLNDGALTLEVGRLIRAHPEKVFDAWTKPELLIKWWGPKGVICIFAEIDLQVGGEYRIGNQLPDDSIFIIEGLFEEIERPKKLVYTWQTDANQNTTEWVTIQFQPSGRNDTNVIIRHQRIGLSSVYEQHQKGWNECLGRLEKLFVKTSVA